MSDTKFKIKTVRVGFGATVMPPEVGGTVKKYYLEPEIELQVPAECTDEDDLQQTLDSLAEDLFTMLQNSVRKKVSSDKAKEKKRDGATG